MVRFIRPSDLELSQQRRGRVSMELAISGLPIANERLGRGYRHNYNDAPNPQVFVSHPVITDATKDATVGGQGVIASLPGRPPAGWDGEMGAGAPTAGWV